MEKFEIEKTFINNLIIIKPKKFEDERGYFFESYNFLEFKKFGIKLNFVQDNHSKSKKGVLRGLHFQRKHPQGKLIRVIKGKIFDVAVDLRKKSETFGKWFGLILSEENSLQFYIPPEFAHGFLSLQDDTEVIYKCSDYYYPEYDSGIIWNDETLNINWPLEQIDKLIISEKDKNLPKFIDYKEFFIK